MFMKMYKHRKPIAYIPDKCHLIQGCKIQFLEDHSPAEFSSNPAQNTVV